MEEKDFWEKARKTLEWLDKLKYYGTLEEQVEAWNEELKKIKGGEKDENKGCKKD